MITYLCSAVCRDDGKGVFLLNYLVFFVGFPTKPHFVGGSMTERILLVMCLFVASWIFGANMKRVIEGKDRGFWSILNVSILGLGCVLLMLVIVVM